MLDNIPRQKQVLQDIYNILSQIAVDVQPPENVSINTSNNIHTIQNFGYNLNPKHYGSYEYAISLKIGVDYNIKNLTATVLTAHLGNIFPKIIREVDENTNKTTIDGIECKFYNNGICASPINKKETKCKNIPSEWCYFKQLAQAKEEIAFLQNTINHFAEKLGIEKPNYTTQKDFAEFINNVENPERITAKEFEQFSQLKEENKRLSSDLDFERSKRKAKEQECDKWKSYYELYRIETDVVKKVQAVINDNSKYGIEFIKKGILDKDERLSYLELHEQIKLIIDEQAKELQAKEQECEELKREIAFGNNGKLSDKIRAIVFKDLNAENSKYKQALDEIKNYQQRNCETCVFANAQKCNINCQVFVILDIINKAKGGE
jgi:hypothetical protein